MAKSNPNAKPATKAPKAPAKKPTEKKAEAKKPKLDPVKLAAAKKSAEAAQRKREAAQVKDLQNLRAKQTKLAREMRLRKQAHGNPAIREMLEENTALHATVETQAAKIVALEDKLTG